MSGKSIDYSITPVSFYKFVCKNPNILFSYVGHTTNFIKRKSAHKTCCRNSKSSQYNTPLYVFIREHGGIENWSMIEIQSQICKDKREAERIETELMEQQQFKLNAIRAYTSEDHRKEQKAKYVVEYGAEYREQHKEQLAIKSAEYYRINRDIMNSKARAKYALKKAQLIVKY